MPQQRLMPTASRSDRIVDLIELGPGAVLVRTRRASHVLGARVDRAGAAGVLRRVRCIERIDLSRSSARMVAVWHRLPREVEVTLGLAVGLALAGIPAFLDDDAPVTASVR